ncbi:MAG: hypothetical protein INH12_29545 [Cupriavidus sp.]|uniref:hypothetical protein n=1 Tax=Cupriavidus sp. TaxID=1873897 RepID=UPI0025BB5AD8|nr:hypothetical protein [Cupriavidus sp.]MCA3186919.1 hypothetical protein [Cupriavidus sp.]MCA3194216.1 hypothetical protein [Cupriavidus sp.]MCA3233247.1 hypothetical protein [Cupriavidus sp.]
MVSDRRDAAGFRVEAPWPVDSPKSIVATNDMRLFSLLHLLGQASLRMEQALWPEDYERMTREVEEALRQATDANARSYTHEEVMQAMQERIDRARDKPC